MLQRAARPRPSPQANVLGILSLIFWSLNFVVTFKYLSLVMRADNRGEGGILALLALARPSGVADRAQVGCSSPLGLFGAALLYGDGMITPGHLGARRGRGSRASPRRRSSTCVVPIAFVIILALFAFQRRGTAGVGAVFGPVMLIWFVVHRRARRPRHPARAGACCGAQPLARGDFFVRERADRLLRARRGLPGGHRRRGALRRHGPFRPAADPAGVVRAWCCRRCCSTISARARCCCTTRPRRATRSIAWCRAWALYPMVVLATAAAVVASQALISGAFSLTRQAVQLGYCPRMKIIHTSKHRDRADLHPRGQQRADAGLPGAGGRLPQLEQPGRHLRRGASRGR